MSNFFSLKRKPQIFSLVNKPFSVVRDFSACLISFLP